MAEPTTAYIGLGSNLGDRAEFLDKAIRMLGESKGVEVVRASELIETAALGDSNQPKYLNSAAEVKTSLEPEELYRRMAEIEEALGRVRAEKWSPRVIDLDLLLYGEQVINSGDLTVPHPQMHLRSFVLKGLCRLNAQLVHPVMNVSVAEMAGRLGGGDFALNRDLPQVVSLAGVIGVGKTTLTKKLANYFGSKTLFESYDTNPYMPQVYAGRKDLALDSQLYFLISRVEQLNHNVLGPGEMVISDYVFDKEMIYARRLLGSQQLSNYQKYYQPFRAAVAAPVLVVYMTDSVQNCLGRIHERNRPYEQKIEPQFLEALSGDYEKLFDGWKSSPVIRISMSESDYSEEIAVEILAEQIKHYIIA